MKWLHGMKIRSLKKYINYINIDGIGYQMKQYSELFNKHSKVKVGDYIFNPYRSIWEKVKTIRITYTSLFDITGSIRHKNTRFYEIVFITEKDFVVYDLDEYTIYFKDLPNIPTPPENLGVCWY